MRQNTYTQGFTLIEVVVAMSILAILTAVVGLNFSEARAKVRDADRAASLEQLQVALELYNAQYGQYPNVGCSAAVWAGPGDQTLAVDFDSCDEYIVGHTAGVNFVPDFIAELPRDPKDEDIDTRGFVYRVEDFNGPNGAYKVMVYQTVEENMVESYANPLARCPSNQNTEGCAAAPQSATYAIYSEGAEDW